MTRFTKKDADYKTIQEQIAAGLIPHEEIADVLLKDSQSAAVSHPDEDIYDLVDEAHPVHEHPTENETLSEQVGHLCREYKTINLQLENSLAASDKLQKQLESTKKPGGIVYLTLTIAALALVGVAAVAAIGWQMQQKIANVQSSTLMARLNQVDEKVNKIFEAENADDVLQVTRALKQQVSDLADKNQTLADAMEEISESDETVAEQNTPSNPVNSPNRLTLSDSHDAADEKNLPSDFKEKVNQFLAKETATGSAQEKSSPEFTTASDTQKTTEKKAATINTLNSVDKNKSQPMLSPTLATSVANLHSLENNPASGVDEKLPSEPAKKTPSPFAQNTTPSVLPVVDKTALTTPNLQPSVQLEHPTTKTATIEPTSSPRKSSEKAPLAQVKKAVAVKEKTPKKPKPVPVKKVPKPRKVVVEKSTPIPVGLTTVASYQNKATAQRRLNALNSSGAKGYLKEVKINNKTWYRVSVKK